MGEKVVVVVGGGTLRPHLLADYMNYVLYTVVA